MFLTTAWTAIKNTFSKLIKASVIDNAEHIAVAIVEGVKTALGTGILTGFAELIDGVIGTHLAEDAIALLNANIDKILADVLALQPLPENATEEQMKAWVESIETAFGLAADKSKIYTEIGAELIDLIKPGMTYGQRIVALETAYTDYLKAKQETSSAQPTAADVETKTDEANEQLDGE